MYLKSSESVGNPPSRVVVYVVVWALALFVSEVVR